VNRIDDKIMSTDHALETLCFLGWCSPISKRAGAKPVGRTRHAARMQFGVGALERRKGVSTQSPVLFCGSFVVAPISCLVGAASRNLRLLLI
jgi:hypothetical protein